jgi:hypothetical protein
MTGKTLLVIAMIAIAAVVAVGIGGNLRAVAAADGDDSGRYRVVAGQGNYVLYEVPTGKSWMLVTKAGDRRFAWLPIKRLDTDVEVKTWQIKGELPE